MPDKTVSSPWSLVWITGASRGIGRALTLALARLGVDVAISARGEDALKQTIQDVQGLPGEVRAFALDVTDKRAVTDTVNTIEAEWKSIDLAVLNAGTFIPMTSDQFCSETIEKHLSLNFMGVCHCIEPLVQRFISRQHGHIAINASLAGYRGLPRSGGYGASKAALINLAESMRVELSDNDIRVQVINPGFVRTPLTEKNTFPMPCIISSEKAANNIVKGLQSTCFEIRFPFGFSLFMGLLKQLPYSLFFFLAQLTR
ncbi:SDR family NAD(P)-dependent oxidoreductase [Candidatus Sororendozoicomonas aggregata]|uniref:SDR family NAD(P)-dependent oxidoreductase n=1 Tax=Candidatus Sororendozoicomonas aggregata TaxID=3073239 RepID=UPI002ED5FB5B